MLLLEQTHREGRCCRRWATTAALWCAVYRQGSEPGECLWRGPGLICQSRGLRRGHRGDADQWRRKKKRNEREVVAASSAALGTADAGAAGSAAACWWLYVQPGRDKEDCHNYVFQKKALGNIGQESNNINQIMDGNNETKEKQRGSRDSGE